MFVHALDLLSIPGLKHNFRYRVFTKNDVLELLICAAPAQINSYLATMRWLVSDSHVNRICDGLAKICAGAEA